MKAAVCSLGNDEKFPGRLPGILNFLKDEKPRRVLYDARATRQLFAFHAERVYRIFPLRQTLIESLTLTPHEADRMLLLGGREETSQSDDIEGEK